jgi:hypothetical protein
MTFRFASILLGLAFLHSFALAADPPAMSAADLAGRLSAVRRVPASYVRLKIDLLTQGGGKSTLQLQIKERQSKGATELVYQVIWPKERKGESVLLRKAGDRAASGTLFVPPETVRSLDAAHMKEPLFGSDLSYEDVVDNFFAWNQQTIVGTETVNRIACQILESKPGKGESSSYASVRTWVDPNRLVPMRVEKYNSAGQLVRRIETTEVHKVGSQHIPQNLLVRGSRSGSSTVLEGSKIRHDVAYTDREFTAEGLKEVTVPRSAPE